MTAEALKRSFFSGAVIFLLLLFSITSIESYAQEKGDPIVKKKSKKERRRLKGKQARLEHWDQQYQKYLRKQQRGTRWQSRKRSRISRSPSVYAQPQSLAKRRFRPESDRVGVNRNVVRTDPNKKRKPPKRKRVTVRSTSSRFVVNKKARPYRFRGKDKWEKQYTGDYYGRREGIQPRNNQRVSFSGQPKPYRKHGRLGDKPYKGNFRSGYATATKRGERPWKGDIRGQKNRRTLSISGRGRIFPSVSPYVQRGTDPKGKDKPAKRRVSIRSASGRYVINKKAKPYKLKGTKKWEEQYEGDYYGRRAGVSPRSTQRLSVTPKPQPYKNRGRLGDKPYKGKMQGGYISATKRGERKWQGDIAGRAIRYSKPRNTQIAGRRLDSSPKSVSGDMNRNNDGRSIVNFTPPAETRRAQIFTGNLRGRRRVKGGGSISGQMNRNNNGRAIVSRGRDMSRVTRYSGNINADELKFKHDAKPLQYTGDIPKVELKFRYDKSDINYSGNIKMRRPGKGGGSVSSKMVRDNNGRAIVSQRSYNRSGSRYTGDIHIEEIKFKFNSEHLQYEGDIPREELEFRFSDAHINYQGNLKARRPEKGGGSVNRGRWNNDGRPLPQRNDSKNARIAGSFSGNLKADKPKFGGGSATRQEPWNNDQTALARKYDPGPYGSHSGDFKLKSNYVRNQYADENALKVRKPGKNYYASANYTGNMKRSRSKVDGKLHASTKFYQAKSNGSSSEEKKFFSFKLLWNKLFGNDTPERDQEKKPRYDKGEKGLWNE